MPLTSTIREYDPEWPLRYDDERNRLAPIFRADLIQIEHVGSTAVPALAAKPEIDILVVISGALGIDLYSAALAILGYRQGDDLAEGHHFFKKDLDGVRTHKLHVMTKDNPKASRMLELRDYLRVNVRARTEYQLHKLKLERENTRGIREYLDGKAPFIDRMLDEAREANTNASEPRQS